MHRARAHRQAEREAIAVEYHTVPAGVPAKLYAASLSAKHGDRIAREDLAAIAREIASANPDFSQQTIATYCGVTRQTVGKWVHDITERRQSVRRVQGLLLTRVGWTQREIADRLAVAQKTVSNDVNADVSTQLGEDLLREAEDLLAADGAMSPQAVADLAMAAEGIRQDRVFATWSDGERDLLKRLRDGETVVVTLRGAHDNLIRWAESAGLYVRIDRKTPWGNPFELPADGDRDTVIRNYAEHYLPHKPSLLSKLDTLAGKALGCWCAPEPCHGDALKRAAER